MSTMAFLTWVSHQFLSQCRILQILWEFSHFCCSIPCEARQDFWSDPGIQGTGGLWGLTERNLEEHQWGQDSPEIPAGNQQRSGLSPSEQQL